MTILIILVTVLCLYLTMTVLGFDLGLLLLDFLHSLCVQLFFRIYEFIKAELLNLIE